jgi:hypothetical protein
MCQEKTLDVDPRQDTCAVSQESAFWRKPPGSGRTPLQPKKFSQLQNEDNSFPRSLKIDRPQKLPLLKLRSAKEICLINFPRWEAFAQAYANGQSAAEAYRLAYGREDRPSAHELTTKRDIQDRIAELQGRAAQRAEISRATCVRRSHEPTHGGLECTKDRDRGTPRGAALPHRLEPRSRFPGQITTLSVMKGSRRGADLWITRRCRHRPSNRSLTLQPQKTSPGIMPKNYLFFKSGLRRQRGRRARL